MPGETSPRTGLAQAAAVTPVQPSTEIRAHDSGNRQLSSATMPLILAQTFLRTVLRHSCVRMGCENKTGPESGFRTESRISSQNGPFMRGAETADER
jgi:hypothetical protein